MNGAEIRPAAVAGSFYPADKERLKSYVGQALNQASPAATGVPPSGLVSPHAGYDYSGAVAAEAYRQIEGMAIERVIVVGPSHRVPFGGASIYGGNAYRTPLGEVKLDAGFIESLRQSDPVFGCVQDAHLREHSIEVHLPFLQIALHDFRLVPILICDQRAKNVFSVAQALFKCLESGPDVSTLLVASSDLYHGESREELREADRRFEEALEEFEPRQLLRKIETGACSACGSGPVAAVMDISRRIGATEARVLARTNSRDANPMPGSSYIVGYAAAMFC